jgi:hypothetical protein
MRCGAAGCGKGAVGPGGRCRAHGGGQRCAFEGCTKAASHGSGGAWCTVHVAMQAAHGGLGGDGGSGHGGDGSGEGHSSSSISGGGINSGSGSSMNSGGSGSSGSSAAAEVAPTHPEDVPPPPAAKGEAVTQI